MKEVKKTKNIKCPNCGKTIKLNDNFCSGCGTPSTEYGRFLTIRQQMLEQYKFFRPGIEGILTLYVQKDTPKNKIIKAITKIADNVKGDTVEWFMFNTDKVTLTMYYKFSNRNFSRIAYFEFNANELSSKEFKTLFKLTCAEDRMMLLKRTHEWALDLVKRAKQMQQTAQTKARMAKIMKEVIEEGKKDE